MKWKPKKNDAENVEWLLILDKDFGNFFFAWKIYRRKKTHKNWTNENIQYYMSFCICSQENLTNKLMQKDEKKNRRCGHLFQFGVSPRREWTTTELWTGMASQSFDRIDLRFLDRSITIPPFRYSHWFDSVSVGVENDICFDRFAFHQFQTNKWFRDDSSQAKVISPLFSRNGINKTFVGKLNEQNKW